LGKCLPNACHDRRELSRLDVRRFTLNALISQREFQNFCVTEASKV
jgi:hypothetical protein